MIGSAMWAFDKMHRTAESWEPVCWTAPPPALPAPCPEFQAVAVVYLGRDHWRGPAISGFAYGYSKRSRTTSYSVVLASYQAAIKQLESSTTKEIK